MASSSSLGQALSWARRTLGGRGHSLGWHYLGATPLLIPPADLEAALSWRLVLNTRPCLCPGQRDWLLACPSHCHARALLGASCPSMNPRFNPRGFNPRNDLPESEPTQAHIAAPFLVGRLSRRNLPSSQMLVQAGLLWRFTQNSLRIARLSNATSQLLCTSSAQSRQAVRNWAS